ncbi:riboflavin biosynthesis protein RibD [Iodidimonas muriae]|uniref:Riboflavin biosynthesis protein RibD n=1 Tax=Iodidimonas muriae TaxID=261467 RepID=A0ABQ2LG77_9PROT|nr:bifunctional diaminohydroxyphosphoribosylaminopyrimidine deaminase/5-amino-6-(5-phosphoribosylamino)uracil reductase RibD [Iodidimonas muriae]GGO16280.1 riboflavin biosynthesis protein RibD [Iodidimonas muriae]
MIAPPDPKFMDMALRLGARGLGRVAPNPAVGCVIVRDGHVVGRGWTAPGGRPHAETVALAQAGAAAKGATAYVTLEPCAHHGRTPPCADALIAAGISHVVVAVGDPDPRTNGQGIARLQQAGLHVDMGLLGDRAVDSHQGFFLKVRKGRPMIACKIAQSLDGCIASSTGHSKWITGVAARHHGHMLRASHDAILVGAGTYRADRPSLDCRVPGLEDRSPQKILMTTRPPADLPRYWWSTIKNTKKNADSAHQEAQGQIIAVDGDETGHPCVKDLSHKLGQRGITRLLVEGGAAITAAFLRAGLVDRLYLYTAPKLIGADGRASVAGLSVQDVMADAPHFRKISERTLGEDALSVYVRA